MMICGFETRASDDPHFQKLVNEYHVGNMILFTRNLDDRDKTICLTSEIRRKIMSDCGIPPFVVIDQDGRKW